MPPKQFDISIIIVNFNVKYFVEQCLRSIRSAREGLKVEIFVVDNGSSDDSLAYLRPRFDDVIFIDTGANLGFGKANNVALEQAKGRYLLILNPDTLIGEDSLREMIRYMDDHPEVGVMGPKILTRTGAFDRTSKRGLPTPWVAFCRLSGLSKLFPRSPIFGRYDLLYLDPDESNEVDSLAGSCMMVRDTTYEQVGGFDEDFFMYGEDIDLCYRIKLSGWKVQYAPVTKIVHFRGESTRRSNFDRDKAFYGAMHLFVEKHFRQKYPIFGHRLIDFGIILARLVAKFSKIAPSLLWGLMDGIGLLALLHLGRYIRFGGEWFSPTVFFVMSLYSLIWVLSLALLGAYGNRRGNIGVLWLGIGLGLLVNSSLTFFVKQVAYSRLVLLEGALLGGLYVWGWRILFSRLKTQAGWQRFYKRRTLIVGTGEVSRKVVIALRNQAELPYLPIGLIDPDEQTVGSFIENLPVLGGESDIARLAGQEEVEEVLFAYDQMDYNRVLQVVGKIGEKRGINFKVIPPETAAHTDRLAPLLSVEFLTPRGLGSSLRKIATLVIRQ